MTAERWSRVQDLFYACAEMDPDSRQRFLQSECAEDQDLQQRVQALLDTTGTHDTLLAPLQVLAQAALGTTAGTTVGVWKLVRQLGQGGMGSVFLAVRADDHYRQEAAVKLIHAGLAGPELLARFLAERQILANLDHPNIARLLDGGRTASGLPYVVMEYVDGVTIDSFCRDRLLDVPARLRLFRQLCEAVIYAHRNLVVHRDIKPANVLVTVDGTPKLLDFGIAKLLSQDGDALTRATERIMTPEYASPEQVRGEAITNGHRRLFAGRAAVRSAFGRSTFPTGRYQRRRN